jgi:DNA-3-methyladenine glycosylase I
VNRCDWAEGDALLLKYHDEEWGAPVHDDNTLFEFLTLEGAQAGLSWLTVLRKRDGYRRCFDSFDPAVVAGYGEQRIEALLDNAAIIRNRLKVRSTVENARRVLEIQDQYGSFDSFLWSYVDHTPLVNRWGSLFEVPARTELSDRIAKDLKRRGFRFVGSTIVYSLLQAVGIVNDHLETCFRYRQIVESYTD